MTALSRAALKAFFETGDKPTEAQFSDLIDSVPNLVDDGIPVVQLFGEYANEATTGTTEQDVGTPFDLPADKLENVGDKLVVYSLWDISANANEKRIGFSVDNNSVLGTVGSTSNSSVYCTMIVQVTKISGTHIRISITPIMGVTVADEFEAIVFPNANSVAADTSSVLECVPRARTPDNAGDAALLSWQISLHKS